MTLADHGFAILPRLLDKRALDTLATSFVHHEQAAIPRSAQVLFVHTPPPPETPAFDNIMLQWLNPHKRLAPLSTQSIASFVRPIVEALLGEPAVLFQDLLLDKGESQRNRFSWHQDYPFWPVDEPHGLVVWAPLDPVDAASGSLMLAAGSHLSGIGPAIDLHSGNAQTGTKGDVIDIDAYDQVCPRVEPGDAIVFHPLIWHASAPNRSGNRRRAWSSSWLSASTRLCHARAPRHPLCKVIPDGTPVTEWENDQI
jgi:ectoine hydroxylase-related dioxygenase (phytanoyl-CoA dioxygenase family)